LNPRAMPLDLNDRPILVFWETTKACPLSCRHCRANAILKPLPGELTTREGIKLIDDVAAFGKPYPVMVFTGGDPLMRSDIYELMGHAKDMGVPVALSPAVSSSINEESLSMIKELGVSSVSISLDGASPETHEFVRRIEGHFNQTINAMRMLRGFGIPFQVNSTVMKMNVHELPALFKIVKDSGANAWEVFFLIHVGRGTGLESLDPLEAEDVVNFLYDASMFGVQIRTVEAPFYRRALLQRYAVETGKVKAELRLGPLYEKLRRGLHELMSGVEREPIKPQFARTRDGNGIIFVGYDGTVTPSGFLPLPLGNVRKEGIAKIYRENPILQAIRRAEFKGRCGACEYRFMCGGSRSRAFTESGDPLGEDPLCGYSPNSLNVLNSLGIQ